MYDWRSLTAQQRIEILRQRKVNRCPWHSPPHTNAGQASYHISAACYEHAAYIGLSSKRMSVFEEELLQAAETVTDRIHAWCILPNHYHLLVSCRELTALANAIGQVHGRTSFAWNGEENRRGRRVWYRISDRMIRSDGHFYATLNYVHNNPVKHSYVQKWQQWPFSSAASFLDKVRAAEAERIWRDYPVLEFGEKWDPPEV